MTVNGQTTVPVASVELNQTTLELIAGKEATLTATVKPDDATNKTVTWSSNNETVATVDNNGKVTAKAAGEAIITAKAGDKTATCTVTVAKADVAVESVTLDKTSLDLKTGDNTTLTATVNPESATNKDVTWISDKPEIAAVEGGTVTAKAAGTARNAHPRRGRSSGRDSRPANIQSRHSHHRRNNNRWRQDSYM